MTPPDHKTLSGPIRTSSPPPAVPLDLRPRRDLLSRRFWHELRRKLIRVAALVASDVIAVGAGVAFATWAAEQLGAVQTGQWIHHIPSVLALVLLGQAAAGTYGPIRKGRRYEEVAIGVLYAFAGLALIAAADGDLQLGAARSLFLALFLGLALLASRLALATAVNRLYTRGIAVTKALVIGAGEEAWEIIQRFRMAGDREMRVVGHLSPEYENDPTALGRLEDLHRYLEEYDVHSVIVSAKVPAEQFRRLVAECFLHGASVSVVPATLNEIPARVSSRSVVGWPMLELQVPRLHLAQLFMKRTLDIVGSLAGILVLSPIMLLTAAAVRLEGAPVLFRQERLGLGGRRFKITKFRSMRPDAEEVLRRDEEMYRTYVENNYKLPEGQDPRLSQCGQFLRRTSLDELPQLFNVLKGEMSLVGPRPIIPDQIRDYGDRASTFLAVKPGVTGWWQVNGRSKVGFPERADLDLEYINGWSLWLDLKILCLTLPRLREGAH